MTRDDGKRGQSVIHTSRQTPNSYTQLNELIPNGTDGSQSPLPDENDNDNTATCRMSGKSESSDKSSDRRLSNSDSFVFVDVNRDVRGEGGSVRGEEGSVRGEEGSVRGEEGAASNIRTPSSDWQVYSVETRRSRNMSKVSLGAREDEKIDEEEEGLVFICACEYLEYYKMTFITITAL